MMRTFYFLSRVLIELYNLYLSMSPCISVTNYNYEPHFFIEEVFECLLLDYDCVQQWVFHLDIGDELERFIMGIVSSRAGWC